MARRISNKHLPKKREQKPVELKWFQKPIEPTDFSIKKDKGGKLYAHHVAWKEHIWIGPYDTEEEIDKIIAQYVANSKRDPMKRKEFKNVHSILIDKI